MTRHSQANDGFLVQPDKVIAALVNEIEPAFDEADVEAAIGQAAPTRAQQRRLATALGDDPGLLTSGRPEGPPQIELLVGALQARGAKRLVLPKCGHCRRPKRLTQRDGNLRICSACDLRRRRSAQACAVCGGSLRHAAYRDHQGRLRCRRCRPDEHPDPTTQLLAHIVSLEPGIAEADLREAVHRAIPQPFQLQQVLWELDHRPELLTGQGAHGSPRINALIQALIAAGAANVVAPACPSCGRTVSLSHRRGDLRCCRRCYDQERLEICSRCQQRTPVTSRTPAGEPVCGNCFRADPNNHERCTACGRIGLVGRREDGNVWCRGCYRAPLATCSLCGRERPCHFASTDRPRCEHCSRLMRYVPCARCGNSRAVWTRTADGQPLCGSCSQQPVPCTSCGNLRKVRARLPEGPICTTCYRKHPASFRPCAVCGVTEHLYHFGLCTRCACRRYLLGLLADDQGVLRPHAEAIYHALLAASDPDSLLQWLTKSKGSTARRILTDIGQDSRPPTHDALDRYRPSRTAHHLRKVLVAGGVLPDRNERLADLEHWVTLKADQVDDPAERRIVRSFATWHHLRRLRRESERRYVTTEQADYAHNEVRAALKLTAWLRENNKRLATCTQHDVDTWLADAPGTHRHARAFLLWTSRRGHTHDLDIPQPARSEALGQIEEDHRWALARGLLHDDSPDLGDRVAGLLVLLYGQPLGRIVRLTAEQVIQHETRVELLLGTVPLDLPAPLDELVLRLLNHARARQPSVSTSRETLALLEWVSGGRERTTTSR